MSKKNNDSSIIYLPKWYTGGLASAGAACITHPFDVIKVHLQTENKAGQQKAGVVRTVQRILASDGFFGLYSGLSASLLRQLTYSTARFGVYDVLKQRLPPSKEKLPFSTLVSMAGISGLIGGLAGSPADMVNVRMQNDVKLPVADRRNYKNAFDGLIKIYKNEGVKALYNGATMATARGVVMTIGQLAIYDEIKMSLLTYFPSIFKDGTGTHLTASIGAGVVATTLTQPLDVLKTRFMNAEKRTGLGTCIAGLYREAGLFGFFKGYIPAFVRLAPHTVLTFLFFEQIKLRTGTKVVLCDDHSKNK